MPFELMPLPYPNEAFGTVMSAQTLGYHHGRHHQRYIDKVNAILVNEPCSGLSLCELITTARRQNDKALFNCAAQVWNHNFFWKCLSPEPQRPQGKLLKLIQDRFGTVDRLLQKMAREAVIHFSNGWVWLVLEANVLKVISLHDADTPVVHRKMKPVLALDIWEHAYYLDYQSSRISYAEKVLDNIINWSFVEQNLDGQGILRADQRSLPYRSIREPTRRASHPLSDAVASLLPNPGEQVVS